MADPQVRPLWEFPLVVEGSAGPQKIDLWRTIVSHGVAHLPPLHVDESTRSLEATLAVSGGRPRTVVVAEGRPGFGSVSIVGRSPGARAIAHLRRSVAHLLRLDDDLSAFYALAATDPELAWTTGGAGRMVRSPTAFEEVIKTICTTNCAWSATQRMVGALVEHLGERAPGAPEKGPRGRAFPSPAAMAGAGEDFYREVARAGYRWRYLVEISTRVAEGDLDLEALGTSRPEDIPDDELERRLRELPGVGPYAAAHIMMMLGRYSRLILDSWSRPAYRELSGNRSASDGAIRTRFARYGSYAGLAFWLYVTQDWVADAAVERAVPGPVPV